MAMDKLKAGAILARRRRSLIETYVLMAFGAVVLVWAWFGGFPAGEERWMFISGMLALCFGESLLTSRTSKIEDAEELLGGLGESLPESKETMPDHQV